MTIVPQSTNTNGAFSIGLTADLIEMQESVVVKYEVPDDSIIYFSFNVQDDDTTIEIILTPLSDSEPDLVVSQGV
jgi:hypothetical protein